MNRITTFTLGATALLCLASFTAKAQNAPPTYQADPDVYKVIFEDQNFRVITATYKPGVTDKPHSHPVAGVSYTITDCALKLTSADGKTTNLNPKAGASNAVPITASHTVQNIGSTECRVVLVERK
jgi:quercetin dioxygenase-like cupin family protein